MIINSQKNDYEKMDIKKMNMIIIYGKLIRRFKQ